MGWWMANKSSVGADRSNNCNVSKWQHTLKCFKMEMFQPRKIGMASMVSLPTWNVLSSSSCMQPQFSRGCLWRNGGRKQLWGLPRSPRPAVWLSRPNPFYVSFLSSFLSFLLSQSEAIARTEAEEPGIGGMTGLWVLEQLWLGGGNQWLHNLLAVRLPTVHLARPYFPMERVEVESRALWDSGGFMGLPFPVPT